MGVTKLVEHTYGTHAFMRIMFDDQSVEEIDVFWRDDGEHYQTTGDGDERRRAEIIDAFHALY